MSTTCAGGSREPQARVEPRSRPRLRTATSCIFSDRRGNSNGGAETGEFGFEDVINYPGASSGNPNGNLEAAEDVNDNNTLETYGSTNLIYPGETMTGRFNGYSLGRKNRVLGFRHALKIVNGTLGNLPMPGLQLPQRTRCTWWATTTRTRPRLSRIRARCEPLRLYSPTL